MRPRLHGHPPFTTPAGRNSEYHLAGTDVREDLEIRPPVTLVLGENRNAGGSAGPGGRWLLTGQTEDRSSSTIGAKASSEAIWRSISPAQPKELTMTRNRSITFLASLAALPLAAVALAGCGSSGGNAGASPNPPKTTSGPAATVAAANTGLGTVLVNSQGRTLYLFKKDVGTKSSCYGACAQNWPPLHSTGKPTAGSGADASLLGTSMRSDGKPQVTYNGHPLYLFSGDSNSGDTNGEGISAFGGIWYALSATGNQVLGTSSNSGGGY
jgi:predicted lipoprotein with Yx(FWY)xxD motif